MIANQDNILVFKTNIQTEYDKLRIQHIFDTHSAIRQWNIDLHDVDCVLRIVSDALTPEQVISVVHHNGFECTELP